MTEFLAKWIAAAFLLAFAWAARRRSPRRAGWTFVLILVLLAFEVGLVESALELAAAGLLAAHALRGDWESGGPAVRAGALAAAAALAWFSLRPLPALLGIGS